MNKMYSRVILLSVLLSIASISCAQNLTGIWRGYFITSDFSQYKFELQLKQTGSLISGVSYSYLSTVFYGKATLTGNFNKSAQSALIREIKTVELRMSGGSSACIMKCIFEYIRSGKEEFLEGTFTSAHEKDGPGVKRGENCGGGKVYLRKVPTSDFYIEPFLRKKPNTPVIINQPPVKKDSAKAKVTVPVVKKPVVTKKSETKTNTNTSKTTVAVKPKKDTVQKITGPVISTNPQVKIQLPAVLKSRQNELVKVFTVSNPDVTVKLYDNGEIDDDTISVYLDNKLVLSAKRLTASPLIIKLKMDQENTQHELVMVAENLGRIPPNTSLMIVESGDQRFEARITSTTQKNAMVRFRYQKPE